MLARPIRSAPSLDLVSTSEVITAVAFRNGSPYPDLSADQSGTPEAPSIVCNEATV